MADPVAIERFIRENWRIVPDPETAEYIRTPTRQLRDYFEDGHFSGDCDDAATLAASLLLALGISSIMIAIRMPYEMDFSHVFLRVPFTGSHRGAYIDIDPIVPESQLPIEGYAETIEVYV
jgi:hypothetical protein